MDKSKIGYEYLPKRLVKEFRSITNDLRECRSRNNYLLVVGLVYYHQMSDDASYLHFSPLSSDYWKIVIGSHYSNYINGLVDRQIIQRQMVKYVDDFGKTSNVMGYRINPEFLHDGFSLVKYSGRKKDINTADEVIAKERGDDQILKLGINTELIQMQEKQALVWIRNCITKVINGYLNMEYTNGLPKTLPIQVRIYNDNDGFTASHMSVESAEKIAADQKQKLFYYKDKFVVADVEQFKKIAIKNLSAHYNWQVRSFHPSTFNFSRNKNTLRVYSKLSSLPTALLPFIRINGQYIQQADLKCSQFTLFANLINYYLNHSGRKLIAMFRKKQAKSFVTGLVRVLDDHKDELPEEGLRMDNPVNEYITSDAYKFLSDTLFSDFYTIIKNELNLPQREHGKSIAFRTVFSKPKPENELVQQFRELYPAVIGIINDYKNRYGYNQFAIGLQRIEAEIFIDNIWKQAKIAGINCFTRHDSLVFPINRQKEVEKIIADVFNSFNFIYRVEYEQFNTDEIFQRLIDETDYVDYLDDFDELFYYTMEQADNEKKMQELAASIQEQLHNVQLPERKERDYYGLVSLDDLFELFELDELSLETKLSIETDIANLQSRYPNPHFQDRTNRIISALIDLLV